MRKASIVVGLLLSCGGNPLNAPEDAGSVRDASCPTKTSCADKGAECGTISDGCGGHLDCGDACGLPTTCGGGGVRNKCGCTPETDLIFCQRQGKNCDLFTGFDNCQKSRAINCGTCVPPNTCGTAGKVNVCTQPGGCAPVCAGATPVCNLGNCECNSTSCPTGEICLGGACSPSPTDAGAAPGRDSGSEPDGSLLPGVDAGPPGADSALASDGAAGLDAAALPDASEPLDTGRPAPDADMPLDASVPAYLSMQDAAKLCAAVFKCTNLSYSIQASLSIALDTTDFSACMDWAAGPIPPSRLGFIEQQKQLECVVQATTCGAAGRCLAYEEMDPSSSDCADAGKTTFCAEGGATIDRCYWRDSFHCDNSYYGSSSTCTSSDAGVFTCAAGACQKTQCQGQINYYCAVDGNQYTIDCRVTGHKCGFVASQGYNDCVTRAGQYLTCDTVQAQCAGDAGTVVQVCDGIYWSEFECADLGGACDDTANVPRCKRLKDACQPGDVDNDVCQGSQISLCIGGQKTSFDCASVGLKCLPATGGLTGRCG